MLDLKNAGLTELLNNFYTLTGLKLCIFDTDFEECASTPIKLYPLCLRAREDPEFERRCHSCDAAHMQICRRTRKPLLYRCHAGLTEYLAPLYYEGVIVAFICIGMMTDGTQKEFESIAAYTAQFGISEQTCRELYDKHRHYTPANIKAACSILDACISHIYHQRMLEVRSLDTAQQIEKYINAGKLYGTVKQDGDAMGKANILLAINGALGKDWLDGTDYTMADDGYSIRIPYAKITAE